MREIKDSRIFFALWPDDDLRQRLAGIAAAIPLMRPARRVPDYNLHLTLHFIGNVFRAELACLREQARQVQASRFDLRIDTSGYFGKPRVAWLGCRDVPPEFTDLHHRLGAQLRRCDYRPEARCYHPHVSVARKLQRAPVVTDFTSLDWRVDNFVLIESQTVANGVKYGVIETYPLT